MPISVSLRLLLPFTHLPHHVHSPPSPPPFPPPSFPLLPPQAHAKIFEEFTTDYDDEVVKRRDGRDRVDYETAGYDYDAKDDNEVNPSSIDKYKTQVREPIMLYSPCIHPLFTLYSPFIHLYSRTYTYVHPLYMYIHHIYTIYTPSTPLNTLYTPYIHPITHPLGGVSFQRSFRGEGPTRVPVD